MKNWEEELLAFWTVIPEKERQKLAKANKLKITIDYRGLHGIVARARSKAVDELLGKAFEQSLIDEGYEYIYIKDLKRIAEKVNNG